MGTNYYWYEREPCPHCGRAYEPKHIGKSSCGWCFALHVYPEEGIYDLADWEKLWKRGYIEDEYGERLPLDKAKSVWTGPHEMREIITKRARKDGEWTDAELRRNDAVRGPGNLARSSIDGRHCIGHGRGTWDLLIGEFR